jgi:hypothetical protein
MLRVSLSTKSATSSIWILGATISGDGTIDRDLDVRIQKTIGAFHQLWRIWNSRIIKTPTKIRIYKAAVITILLYGAEVWNTTKKQMKRFEVFHQTSLRSILKIRWFFHVSNEEVLKRAGIKSIETFISAARLRWYGHVVRMPNSRTAEVLTGLGARIRKEVEREAPQELEGLRTRGCH